jgi:outer membrane protein OmpA-like peptidoglycan-associated protein
MMRFFLTVLLNSCVVLCTAQEFIVEKLPEFINSSYDEIVPVPSRDGNTLYFTRVGYPEFDHTLRIDTTDYSKKLTADKYDLMLADIYSQIEGSRISNAARSTLNQDVWLAKADSFTFSAVSHPGPPLNNALPNSLVSITPDPNSFYIINQFKENGDMAKGFSIIRRGPDGQFMFPEPVEIRDYYTIKSEVSLTMSFDGEILILAAVRYDSRDMDLYVCFREGENKWSAPKHMGNTINSSERELTPFISEDHRTLYFASNRFNTTGGYDLFVSRRVDDTWTNWTTPARLDKPINSKSDESQPYFNMTSGQLYFTSKRDGSSDIYRVQIAPPQPTELYVKGRILNSQTGKLIEGAQVRYGGKTISDNLIIAENGYYSLKIPKGVLFNLTPEKNNFLGKPDSIIFRRDYYYFQDYYTLDLYMDPSPGYIVPNEPEPEPEIILKPASKPLPADGLYVKGRILNRKTGQLIPGATLNYNTKAGDLYTAECPDGMYSIQIPKGVLFELNPEMMGLAGEADSILFREDYVYTKEYYTLDLYMNPLSAGNTIKLKPIFFQQSRDIILEQSYPELSKLADLLQKNPEIHIRVEGHTDNVGRPSDLLRLSEDRAVAVKNFLTEQGIHGERIQTKGFGASKPLNKNQGLEERKANRRVEVVITKTE